MNANIRKGQRKGQIGTIVTMIDSEGDDVVAVQFDDGLVETFDANDVETDEQKIKRIEDTIQQFGDIKYMYQDWSNGAANETQDAEDDVKWLIERAKRCDLLEHTLQEIADVTREVKTVQGGEEPS